VCESASVVTQAAEPPGCSVWRFCEASRPAFNPNFFNIDWLEQSGLITGRASAGRGNTYFLNVDGRELVLRLYRRGGLVQKISRRQYVWQGLDQTRSMCEFEMLRLLHAEGLPAPRPFACEVTRHRLTYTAGLITYKLSGDTLANWYLGNHDVSGAAGSPRQLFHDASVWHADLNAHNVLIDESGAVALLDFDRACIKSSGRFGWRQKNLQRLRHSLEKLAATSSSKLQATDWHTLVAAYNA